MKIGLYGIGGVYNYGCEAIVRGTVKILKMINPDCHIIYYSRRAIEDKNKLNDLDIDIYQISDDPSISIRIMNKLFQIAKINYRISFDDYNKMHKECDVLVSIGGDIYTIPQYIRTKRNYSYYNNLIQFGEKIIQKGKKLIIFGASIGPFGKYEKAKAYYFNHLKKVDLIIVRESETHEYLKENRVVDNVCTLPDPAFFVLDEKSNSHVKIDESEYIGINLSPLSLKEIYGDVTLEYKKKIASLISNISRDLNLKVMLIPHVISPITPMDNDLTFLNEISKLIDDDIKENVEVIDNAEGFIETKKHLKKCKIVVAARMHCAINAICESVPTILLSYSTKAKGMAKFVYGSNEWVLPMNKIEEELPDKIKQMIPKTEEIHKHLENRVEEIREIEKYKEVTDKILEIVQ